MNSNTNPVSKRLKTETSSFEDEKASIPQEMDGSASGESSQVINSDQGVCTYANIFTDDILPDIFDNLEILTAKDLLTFRLVNRCWRDAATSVLLKRNLCQITLHFNKVLLDQKGSPFGWAKRRESGHSRGNLTSPPADYKYFSYYKSRNFLSDLNELISTSRKFPCNTIRFDEMALFGFGALNPPTKLNDATQNQQDLFRFFDLHGKKIKEMWLGGEILKGALQKLLYVYLPHLSCLDFGQYLLIDEDRDEDEDETDELPAFLSPPAPLEIKEIVWGFDRDRYDGYWFETELIEFCPNLSCITRVDVSALDALLEIGKSHLIQELELNPQHNYDALLMLNFSKLLTDASLKANDNIPCPKLRKLKVMFWMYQDNFDILWKVLNLILSGSKDTLEYLEFFTTCSESPVNLFIPPLPRLQTLKLIDNCKDGKSFDTKIHFRGDVIGEAMRAGKISADQTVDDVIALASQNHGSSNVPADYFPRLRKVKMLTHETQYDPHKLMGLFSIENLGPSSSVATNLSDTLLSVTTLSWDENTQQQKSPYDNLNMSKLFPNVKNLKIVCWYSKDFPNWIWTFSKLEKCKITGLPKNQPNTKVVDSFFTGFSQEFCGAFEGNDAITESGTSSSAQGFERTRPYIGNCKNLKELTIKCYGKLNLKFASKLTADYGFQDVIHRTKILICFCGLGISDQEIKESSQYLDSVAAYVEIKKAYK